MDILGDHYCSSCLHTLPDEQICPFCGHNPEEKYERYILEEGTLLNNRRYRIGVPNHEDNLYCYYGAWDYLQEKPVMIQEFFPKDLITRNILDSDDIIILKGKESLYWKKLNEYIQQSYYNKGKKIIDHFTENSFGYRIFEI